MPKIIRYDKGWRVNFRHAGKRYVRRFQKKKYPDAKKAAEKYIESIVSGQDIEPELTVADTIDKYLNWSEKIKQKSPNTIRSDKQRLLVFAVWCNEQSILSPQAIDVAIIRRFQEYYFDNAPFVKKHQRRKYSPASTWEKYRQVLSAFFNWSVNRDYMNSNPLSKNKEFKIRVQKKKPEIFTADELKKLFEYFDGLGSAYVSTFFRFLAYTGCRLAEAINLKWMDVDLSKKEINFVHTKNYKPRTNPIDTKLLRWLKKLPPDDVYVFGDGNGGKLYHPSWYWKLLRKATDALGMRPHKIHAFRHTFCSALAAADINLATIKELAGHEDIETTLIYVQFNIVQKKKAIKFLTY